MSFDKCKDVWVFIECFQGEPKSVGFKVGAVIHPIAMSYEEKELIRSMNTTESKVYFAPTFFYKTDYEQRILAVMDQIPSLKGVVMLDYARERKSNLPSLAEIINAYPPLPKEECAHELTGQDITLILCTSGTTGGTKGVLLTHDNIRYSEETFNRELELDDNDSMFMPAALILATGFQHGVFGTRLLGAKVVIQRK